MALYKISVTVNLINGKNHLKWSLFCRDNNFEQVTLCNFKGEHSIQYIITKWCCRDSLRRVIEYAQEITGKIQHNGFNVLRTKVSSPWSHNVDVLPLYHECTVKVNIRRAGDFDKLCNVLCDFLGLSIESRNGEVCITMHDSYDTIDDSIVRKDRIIRHLKSQELHLCGRIVEESIYYDTNPDLDSGRF